ncbi:MAG: tetratricopeptide repeat protein [Actinomycetota bacterium]|nr:tetratricopeptide repeat protein [Actinomycetota bacterium]
MLFDLTSPGRKTAVRIIFGFLAVIFASGFVLLGIGTEGGQNPLESIFGSNNTTDGAFEQQIEDAEQAVEDDPQDSDALASLVVLRARSGDAQLEVDEETGQPVGLTDDSRGEYEEAISVWQQYLDVDPKKIDLAAASAAVLAYRYLGDVDGAISAQEALAESDPSGANFGALASFLYADLQIEKGDKARDQALAEANEETKKLITQQLGQIRKQAVKAEKAQSKQPDSATGGGSELADPFGGLSPTEPGGTLDPGAPSAP